MWYKEKFFKYTSGIILILLIIFLLGQLGFFFEPFKKFLAVLFFPVVISGLFYYLLRPLIRLGERIHLSRTWAILLTYLLVLIIFAVFSIYAGSFISKQFNQLIADLPEIIESGRVKAQGFLQIKNFGAIFTGKVGEQLTAALQKGLPFLINHLVIAISALTGFASVLFLVPFILFYFLKDDVTFTKRLLHHVPPYCRNEVRNGLTEADRTLSTYIIGQGVLALILGVLSYVGYLIIGVHYSLILALFAMVVSFIPVFGPLIGVIPAVLIGFTQGLWVVVKILILVILIHFLEGNLISPHLIGRRLKIHPLTIIFLFLVSASLFGFIGMLIAVPVYAVGKIIVKSAIRVYKAHLEY